MGFGKKLGKSEEGFIVLLGEVACPSGEQITNGGFETGDFTGWTKLGTFEVVTYLPYEGTYSARTLRGKTGTISQTFATPIPVVCFTGTSIFHLYWSGEVGECPVEGSKLQVVIGYTDETSTILNFEFPAGEKDPDKPYYYKIDLIPYLEAGKTVESITVTLEGWANTLPYVDAFSLIP